jgi:hypothetical protein
MKSFSIFLVFKYFFVNTLLIDEFNSVNISKKIVYIYIIAAYFEWYTRIVRCEN